jgi:cell fate (sporulation/competence/biofilm development) regulator YmcA (YheA/YmcA/DUF963 family)
MQISFNPRISKSFAKVILKSKRVTDLLHDIDSLEEREEIVHQILIEGFTKYKIDINDLINHLKED